MAAHRFSRYDEQEKMLQDESDYEWDDEVTIYRARETKYGESEEFPRDEGKTPSCRNVKRALRQLRPTVLNFSTEIDMLKKSQDAIISMATSQREVIQALAHDMSSIREAMGVVLNALTSESSAMSKGTSSVKDSSEEVRSKSDSPKVRGESSKPKLATRKEPTNDKRRGPSSISDQKEKFDEDKVQEAEKTVDSSPQTVTADALVKRTVVLKAEKFDEDKVQEAKKTVESSPQTVTADALVKRTVVLKADDEKMSRIRNYYEKIYSVSPLTSCILTFLQTQSKVRILVDFNSSRIWNMKPNLTDYDGKEWSGEHFRAFADFEKKEVYLGLLADENYTEIILMGLLARALARMTVYLAFENKGMPYSEDDGEMREQYRNILKEAESKRADEGEKLDPFIYYALSKETQIGKEINLIVTVPGMISVYGSQEGTSRLKQQLPSLLRFYEEHVMPKLVRKSVGELVLADEDME